MRSAVFGLGPMGKRHISALKELGFEIAGLCDKSEDASQKAREEFGLARELFFTDAAEMLKRSGPELVIIATNTDSHSPLTLLSAEKGAKYILCEKPMAASVKACREMIDICRENGARLAVNHPQRYMKRFAALSALAASEEMGGPESVTFVSANAGLAMMGSHFLEMARIVLNENIVKVSACLSRSICPNPRGEKFDDPCGTVVGTTLSGRRVVMVLGNESGLGIRMVVSCKYGMIDGDLIGGKFIIGQRTPESRGLPPTRYGCPSETRTETLGGESVVESAKNMISGLIHGDEAIESSAGDAMRVIQVLAAASRSSDSDGLFVDVEACADDERTFPWP